VRKRLLTALLGLVSLGSSIAAFELVGRILLRRALTAEHIADVDHRLKPDPSRGINRDGIRSDREAAEFAEASHNIIFLGDSYTFGVFVKAEQAFPSRVERQLAEQWPSTEVRVANFGWSSSSRPSRGAACFRPPFRTTPTGTRPATAWRPRPSSGASWN
jgi:hypothetical protein